MASDLALARGRCGRVGRRGAGQVAAQRCRAHWQRQSNEVDLFDCPCRTGHRIMLNADPSRPPYWTLNQVVRLTISPSVDSKEVNDGVITSFVTSFVTAGLPGLRIATDER